MSRSPPRHVDIDWLSFAGCRKNPIRSGTCGMDSVQVRKLWPSTLAHSNVDNVDESMIIRDHFQPQRPKTNWKKCVAGSQVITGQNADVEGSAPSPNLLSLPELSLAHQAVPRPDRSITAAHSSQWAYHGINLICEPPRKSRRSPDPLLPVGVSQELKPECAANAGGEVTGHWQPSGYHYASMNQLVSTWPVPVAT